MVFVDELDEVPPMSTVVFSADGVSPEVREQARVRDLRVIDATCPLVTKVRGEAKRFAERGDTIVLIGYAGHEESEGRSARPRTAWSWWRARMTSAGWTSRARVISDGNHVGR